MRSGVLVGFSLVFLALGCGLTLVPDDTAVTPKDDASTDASPPPLDGPAPPVDGSPLDGAVPPTRVTYVFASEIDPKQPQVVAMNELSATNQVFWSESDTSYLAFDFANTVAEFYSFIPASKASSIALTNRGATSDDTVAFFTETGEGLFVVKGTSSPASFGDCATVSRVSYRSDLLFVAMPSSGTGTRITSIPAASDGGTVKCADGALAYDGAELTGHALSPSTLRLAGLEGAGPTLALKVFSRANAQSTFATALEVSVEGSTLGGAVEVVSISDDISTVKLRAPCRAPGASATCLVTLNAKP